MRLKVELLDVVDQRPDPDHRRSVAGRLRLRALPRILRGVLGALNGRRLVLRVREPGRAAERQDRQERPRRDTHRAI